LTDRYLRTGIFLAPFHALDENPTLAIERDMELVQHLDRLNYHEAWIGEHHSGGFEIIASPEMFIAAAAERTRHIRLGTGVVSLPYHNPFMLASRMTQLDHMTRGRAMFGVGPGALIHDAAKVVIAHLGAPVGREHEAHAARPGSVLAIALDARVDTGRFLGLRVADLGAEIEAVVVGKRRRGGDQTDHKSYEFAFIHGGIPRL